MRSPFRSGRTAPVRWRACRSKMLAALQRGIPLSRRPFEDLSREIGCAETDLIGFASANLKSGDARRFGAVFDARRLGYRSALCCATAADPDGSAAMLSQFPEVTHCYLREAPGCPNLWWTWSSQSDSFDESIDKVRKLGLAFRVLPAVRRYKIDVMFGTSTRACEEDPSDRLSPPDETGRRIIRALQGSTVPRPDYYSAIAAEVGMKEWDLLATLEIWRRQGRLKRIGLVLNHRKAGYSANGMCCFRIDGDTTEAGRALASLDEVSHCYERPPFEDFRYNLYAMIHSKTTEGANRTFGMLKERLAAIKVPPTSAVMLISTKEYKKTSMTFYERG